MRNIQILVEYDGTAYCGWQIQPNGLAIQQVLVDAWRETTGEDIRLIGSGRTDAGVHAYGQSANFHTDCSIPVEKIPFAINPHLPSDIRVFLAQEREHDFHSRFSAKGKIYEYRVLNNQHGSSLRHHRMWHVREPLHQELMNQAVVHFLGTHDFTAFSSVKSTSVDKVRTIHQCSMVKCGDEYVFSVEGTGFLYNMVRIMVGTVVEIGRGQRAPEEIRTLLLGQERNRSGITAPPQGLYLKKVIY
jgi:tRNA pseudouridine38-40 synthase